MDPVLRSLLVVLLVGCAHTSNKPSVDSDSDGIIDSRDRCPDQPEDLDGFEDSDGCYDPDNDRDGIADRDDLCPNQPEDLDSFEDNDGCPDPDNDRDRIADTKDRCPIHPELYNGFEDNDGCPEPDPYDERHGSFTDNVFLARPIFFDAGSAALSETETRYLQRYAAWLRSEPAVGLIAVIGHASTDEQRPRELGQRRADVVLALLAKKVARHRLRAFSAGTKPAAEWAQIKRAVSKDRSVHFRYFEVAGKEVYRWNGQLDVPSD